MFVCRLPPGTALPDHLSAGPTQFCWELYFCKDLAGQVQVCKEICKITGI